MRLDNRYVLILTVLILSVSIASGVGVAQSSESISDGDRYWVGQNLTYDVGSGASNGELVRGDNNTFVTELDINNTSIRINSSGYVADSYNLTYDNSSGSEQSVGFNLTDQNLSVSSSDSQVTNNSSTGVNLDYESNRNGFNMSVSADNVSDSDLSSLFNVNESDLVEGEVIVNSTESRVLNFTGFEADTYNFTFDVTDSDTEADLNVTVTESTDANVEIQESVVTTAEGDKAGFTLEFESTNDTNVTIGNESDVGYEMNLDVQNEADNDDSVRLQFNTYYAGTNNSSSVITVHEDSEASVAVYNETTVESPRLSPATYDVSASVDGRESDFGEIEVTERETQGVRVKALPNGTNVNEASDVGGSGYTSEVAQHDVIALEVEMTGLYGYLEDGDNVSGGYNGLYVDITEDSPNSDSSINMSNTSLYTQPADDRFYVVFDADASNIDVGSDYTVEAGLNNSSDYIESEDEEESVVADFRTVERDTEFVTNQNNTVEVSNESMIVSAETNIAENTESTLLVRNTDSPNLEQFDVDVEEGEFRVNISDANISTGDNFTVQLRGETDEVDGTYVDVVPESPNDTDDGENNNTTEDDNTTEDNNVTNNSTDNNTTGTDDSSGGLIQGVIDFILGLLGL